MAVQITFNDQYLNQTVNKDKRVPGDDYRVRAWHETANGSGNPHNTLNWNLKAEQTVKGKTYKVYSSYDVLIDRSGVIWRYVDWKVWNSWSEGVSEFTIDGKKYESGPLGRMCMGIELDGANDGIMKATEPQIEAAALFAIYTAETEGIPLDGKHDVTHAQIAPWRKTDPRGYTIAQVYAAIRDLQQGTAIDWQALWGDNYPYFAESGIAQRWRQEHLMGKGLGEAESDEYTLDDGRVVRLFDKGAIWWTPSAMGVWR
jgi:hypothetical protein